MYTCMSSYSNGQSTAKSIPVFKPMKFVPGSAHGASNPAKWTPPQTGNDGGDDKKLIKTITGDLAPAVGTSVRSWTPHAKLLVLYCL